MCITDNFVDVNLFSVRQPDNARGREYLLEILWNDAHKGLNDVDDISSRYLCELLGKVVFFSL